MRAGVTRTTFPPDRIDDVRSELEMVGNFHQNLKREGLREAFFLISEEAGEALGIAIWDDDRKLREVEGKPGSSRAEARHAELDDLKDERRAPTDYSKKRAAWVEESGQDMQSAEWYDIVFQVR